MAQKMTGALVFDERTDRYDIRFDLNSYYGGLHCGECFDVFVRGKWTQTMRKRSAEEKQKQLERFLMNVAEAADAALWEYWREKEAEHRRFATEYVTRRGLIPQQ